MFHWQVTPVWFHTFVFFRPDVLDYFPPSCFRLKYMFVMIPTPSSFSRLIFSFIFSRLIFSCQFNFDVFFCGWSISAPIFWNITPPSPFHVRCRSLCSHCFTFLSAPICLIISAPSFFRLELHKRYAFLDASPDSKLQMIRRRPSRSDTNILLYVPNQLSEKQKYTDCSTPICWIPHLSDSKLRMLGFGFCPSLFDP